MCAYSKYKEGAVFVGKDNHIYTIKKRVNLKDASDACAGCCFSDRPNHCLQNTLKQVCGTEKCTVLIQLSMIFKDITKGV